MAGEITRKELHPDLLEELLAGGGSAGVELIQETKSVTATTDGQKEFAIPMDGFNKRIHKFELRMGSVVIYTDRYTIQGNKVVFNASEAGVTQGRRLDFAFTYLKQTEESVMEQLLDVKPADVEIEGRTLVNILGRAGNAIYKQLTAQNSLNSTLTYDGDMFVVQNTNENMHSWLDFSGEQTEGRYYIAVAEVNSTLDGAHAQIHGTLTTAGAKVLSSSKANTWEVIAICSRADMTGMLNVNPTTGIGSTAKYRNVRCYEVSKEEYDNINVLEDNIGNKLAQKYPYVDDIKCVVNPYVECNENLIVNPIIAKEGYLADGKFIESLGSGAVYIQIKAEQIKTAGDYTLTIENLPEKYTLGSFGSQYTNHIQFNAVTPNINKYVAIVSSPTNTSFNAKEVEECLTLGKWKITVVKGSAPKTYEECHNSRVMFETKLYDGEKITRDNSGNYVKNSEWSESAISDITIKINNSYTGYKITSGIPLPETAQGDNSHLVRYDGKLVAYKPNASADEEKYYVHGMISNFVVLCLPNTLTGWGDNYTPTSEEIRAFFLGWRMFTSDNDNGFINDMYNGTGVKRWVRLWCGIGGKNVNSFSVPVVDFGGTNDCPTTTNDQGYTPYRLIYKKETPSIEEVITHGSLVVKDGVGVSVSSGLVLGENYSNHLCTYGETETLINCDHRFLKARPYKILNILNDKGYIEPFSDRLHGFVYPDSDAYIRHGNSQGVIKYDSSIERYFVDYLLWGTVASFPCIINKPQTTKEIIEKTIEELSNTNEKLSAENRELHNKIENLPQVSNPNLLINGDFQVWQRGESFTSVGNTAYTAYTADRWGFASVSDVKPILKKSINHNGYIVSFPETSNRNTRLQQFIEDGHRFNGKTLTLSFCAKSLDGVARKLGAQLVSKSDFSKPFGSKSFELTGGFKTYTLTTTIKEDGVTNGDMLTAIFGFSTHVGNYHGLSSVYEAPKGNGIEFKWIKLEIDNKATSFSSRHYAEELMMCQRYYQSTNPNNMAWCTMGFGNASSTGEIGIYISTPITMRVSPTINFNIGEVTLGDYNNGSITVETMSTWTVDNGGLYITCNTTGGLKQYSPYYLQTISSNHCVGFDAEIY